MRNLNFISRFCLVLALLISSAACANPAPTYPITFSTPDNRQITFTVEVARTPQELAQGLMHRESLPQDAGMLFLFSTEAQLGFWMKNTLIPLDMIFINSANRVVHIAPLAEPLSEKPVVTPVPAQKVLEINGGLAAKLGLTVGSILDDTAVTTAATQTK